MEIQLTTYVSQVYSVIVIVKYLEDATWTRTKGNDITIGYAIVVSVSTSGGRHLSLAFSSYTVTRLPYRLETVYSCTLYIYI